MREESTSKYIYSDKDILWDLFVDDKLRVLRDGDAARSLWGL